MSNTLFDLSSLFLFLHKQKSFKAINFSDLFVYCPLLSSPPKRRVCNFPDLFWAVILTKGGDFWLADVALSLSGVMLPCSDVLPLFCFFCLHAPVLLPSFWDSQFLNCSLQLFGMHFWRFFADYTYIFFSVGFCKSTRGRTAISCCFVLWNWMLVYPAQNVFVMLWSMVQE